MRPWLVGELAVVVALLFVYDQVRSHAAVRADAALNNALNVLSLERLLHVDVELTVNRWFVAHPGLADVAAWFYQLTFIGVTLTVLALAYIMRPAMYRPARNALVMCNVAGLVVFFVFPVMPPRLLPGQGYVDASVLAGFTHSEVGPVNADLYGAMPSLHVAWAMWVALAVAAMLRRHAWRHVVLIYPLLTSVAVVATANHYVLDVAAGLVVALAAAAVTGFLPAVQGSARPSQVRSLAAAETTDA